MNMLTRESILQADDLQTHQVEVPEWGGSVLVRGLTGNERDTFEASIVKQDGKNQKIDLRDIRAKLVALCVVNESGARIFSSDDITALSTKSGAALQRIFAVAQKLSGLSDADIDELADNAMRGAQTPAANAEGAAI